MVEYKIDIVLMSSTDRRWNELRTERIRKLFKPINKNIEIIVSDSGEQIKTENGYLLGGTMGIFTGKLAGMIVKEHNTKDKFER